MSSSRKKSTEGVVYMYTSPFGKKYIGQTWNETLRRNSHSIAPGGCAAFHSAIRKYGYENFKYEVLYKGIKTQEMMDQLEKQEIIKHNTISPNGYNLSEGGSTGKFCDESCKKMSVSAKKRPPSPRAIEGMRIAWKGHHHSEESKQKIREANMGRSGWKHTLEAREKIRNAGMGKHHSEESIQKMRASKIGKPRSPETIEKIRNGQTGKKRPSARKYVRCIELNVVFDCVETAANVLSGNVYGIRNAINGTSKTSGGYHWEYL
jgi:group I intron endonuclease